MKETVGVFFLTLFYETRKSILLQEEVGGGDSGESGKQADVPGDKLCSSITVTVLKS
jgi:hypothetical protein